MLKVRKEGSDIFVEVNLFKILVALFVIALIFIIAAQAGASLDTSFDNQDLLILNHKANLKYGG